MLYAVLNTFSSSLLRNLEPLSELFKSSEGEVIDEQQCFFDEIVSIAHKFIQGLRSVKAMSCRGLVLDILW